MKRTNVYCKIVLLFSALVLLATVQPLWAVDHAGWQARPIQLGTSGGNINDSGKLYCCGGTLGALVQDVNGGLYILSNNHVLARTNLGIIGEDIIQPGLIDRNPVCAKNSVDAVADLSRFVRIAFKRHAANKVDAAIAAVRDGAVDTSGSILEIGKISNSIAAPALNMPVQKSGRTTGLTHGRITGVDVTVNVTYDKTCGTGSQTTGFTDQIMIRSVDSGEFSTGGDSGSLILEDSSSPRAVGLLFAGSNTVTIANPIGNVLSSLGVSMVGEGTFSAATTTVETTSSSTATRKRSQLHADNMTVKDARKIKERHKKAILLTGGVVGVGIGISEKAPDQAVIEVYTKRPVQDMRKRLPHVLEGIPVRIVETGEIIAY